MPPTGTSQAQDHTPDQVVGEVPLDRDADRFLEEGPPGLLVVDAAAQFVAGGQRLGEGGEDPLGEAAGHAVEALPGLVLALAAGEPGECLPSALFSAADQESGGPAVPFHGGVRRDGARTDTEVQPEIPHDLLRQQADQVRVPGQAGVDAREGTGGDGRSPGVVQPLQDQHGPAGAGQVGGGDQAVVASADDDGVVRTVSLMSLVCRHGPS
jgi:hypothetical protein